MMVSAKASPPNVRASCWDCGAPLEGPGDLCGSCHAPQPPPEEPVDLFAFLEVSASLSPDEAELQEKFHERSRRLHPDRFGRASAEAQRHSMARSALLNRAYRTLKNPGARGAYLLTAEREALGLKPTGGGGRNVPVELAEEYFEMQQALAEGEGQALGRIRARLLELKEENQATLAELAERWDREGLGAARAAGTKRAERTAFARDLERALDLQSYLRRMEENVGRAAAGGA